MGFVGLEGFGGLKLVDVGWVFGVFLFVFLVGLFVFLVYCGFCVVLVFNWCFLVFRFFNVLCVLRERVKQR